MNNKMLTIAAVLAAALVTGVFATTPMAAFADRDYDGDSSETNTEQKIKQSNEGGEGSTNFNCASNDINSGPIDAQICGTLSVEVLDDLVATLR